MADGLLNKASIILTPTGYKAGTLYNVAPVVEPYEDFDFARASVASRVNSSGLVEMVGRTLSSELITNGDFATDSDWNKDASWSISDGKAIYDGSSNGHRIKQNVPLTIGKKYKATLDILDSSGRFRISVDGGSSSFNTYTSGNGSYSFYFTSTSVEFSVRGSLSDSASTFSIDNVSVKEIIDTNNIPRISYDSNGDNGHILLEPTSTNLLPYSEDFSQWSADDVEVVNNATTSPNGDVTATLIKGNTNASRHHVAETTLTNTITASFSVFAKAKELRYLQVASANSTNQVANFDLLNGTIGTVGAGFSDVVLEEYPNDWYRISLVSLNRYNSFYISLVSSTTASWLESWSMSNNTDGLYIWGAQLEELSYTTSYIPSLTGSAVTRATETATGAGSSTLINSTEGVLYAEIAALVDTDTTNPNRGFSISSGSTNNTVYIYYQSAVNKLSCILISNGTTQFSHSTTLFNVDDYLKIALKYRQNDFALWVDGVEVATDTIGNAPSGLNKLAFDNGAGNDVFYGKCKALAVFNEALSDSELTQLTT